MAQPPTGVPLPHLAQCDDERVKSDVLDELYAVPPEKFIATRTALSTSARAAGDREAASAIARLRKPTVAAWAINALVHQRPLDVEPFCSFAPRLRHAQSTLDAPVMRQLRAERDTVLSCVVTSVEFVAQRHGRPLTPAVVDEVRMTLVAALADEAAQAAVFSGHLVRPLTYAGFGEVDLDDAVASEALPASRAAASTTDQPAGAPAAADGDEGPTEAPAADAVADSAPHSTRQQSTRAPRRTDDRAQAKRARNQRVRAQKIARERQRLEHAMKEADHALAQVSLQRAERVRLAENATRRADELEGLLIQARQEAEDAQARARQVEDERKAAQATLDHLRGRLDALDSRA